MVLWWHLDISTLIYIVIVILNYPRRTHNRHLKKLTLIRRRRQTVCSMSQCYVFHLCLLSSLFNMPFFFGVSLFVYQGGIRQCITGFRGERGCYYSTCIKKEKMKIRSWLRKLFIMDCKIILFDRKGIVIKINFSLNKNTSYYMWFHLVAVWIL